MEDKNNSITLDPEILKALEVSAFLSGKLTTANSVKVKNGRGVHLLKAGSKEKRAYTKPKAFPLTKSPEVGAMQYPQLSRLQTDATMNEDLNQTQASGQQPQSFIFEHK